MIGNKLILVFFLFISYGVNECDLYCNLKKEVKWRFVNGECTYHTLARYRIPEKTIDHKVQLSIIH